MIFDFIGAALFGATYGAASASDNSASNNIRENAKKRNQQTYVDVDGNMRWVGNNRKLTAQEIHDAFPSFQSAERKEPGWRYKEYIERQKTSYKKFSEESPIKMPFEDYLMWVATDKDFLDYRELRAIRDKYTAVEYCNLRKNGRR